MISRRNFISQAALAGGSLLLGSDITGATEPFASNKRLTILHTNDVHSRIDPVPLGSGSRFDGLGGVDARAGLINQIRSQEENVLLFDAGDIFQGTPYFNVFKGEVELKSMSLMRYDAGTIGNHEFDEGLENLATQITKHASFPMVICNYDFTATPMEGKCIPYRIFKTGGLKIGMLGVGIQLEGVVDERLYRNTKYFDPVQKANQYAYQLKKENCDLIICLSHLGYSYSTNRVSDVILARESENIDLIIGGHTHTFLDTPVTVKNKNAGDVIIVQQGWGGVQMGRLDFIFERKKGKRLFQSQTIPITKKSGN
ncbi:MAG: bifunctional UDP-sugar hydrolase/5'-nucleotidase [Chitinophagaceae bacterium]